MLNSSGLGYPSSTKCQAIANVRNKRAPEQSGEGNRLLRSCFQHPGQRCLFQCSECKANQPSADLSPKTMNGRVPYALPEITASGWTEKTPHP